LTSYNDVRTIGAVARAAREGLNRDFGSFDAHLLLADGGSRDGTVEAAREGAGSPALIEVEHERGVDLRELPYHGHPCRAAALRAVLQAAHQMNAAACAVVDAGIQTMEPGWVERLVGPVISDGFDYVSPYYLRHAQEGAITKSIVYPMFRALYGVRLRQPAASEFGCSPRLLLHYLEQDFWDADHASCGIDLWLAVSAACGEFRICETALGARGAVARGPQADLSTTLAQVVGAVFGDLERRVDVWQRVRGTVPVPILGDRPALQSAAPPLNVEALTEAFRFGYRELREVWTWVLPPRTIVELRKLTEAAPDRFRFDDRFWASIVYDFALGHAFHALPRDHLLRSLRPLYSGWLASFILQMNEATLAQIEDRVEQVCKAFELEKRYLISRWRWPERLR
jgi:hypothetical protein